MSRLARSCCSLSKPQSTFLEHTLICLAPTSARVLLDNFGLKLSHVQIVFYTGMKIRFVRVKLCRRNFKLFQCPPFMAWRSLKFVYHLRVINFVKNVRFESFIIFFSQVWWTPCNCSPGSGNRISRFIPELWPVSSVSAAAGQRESLCWL